MVQCECKKCVKTPQGKKCRGCVCKPQYFMGNQPNVRNLKPLYNTFVRGGDKAKNIEKVLTPRMMRFFRQLSKKKFSPTSGSEPMLRKVWFEEGIVDQHNCYSYAINDLRLNGRMGGANKATPGLASTGRRNINNAKGLSCKKMVAATLSDLRKYDKGSSFIPSRKIMSAPARKGYYKVVLVSTSDPINSDFHWYRQDPSGWWSHKPGHTPPTRLDASGKLISDPTKANRNTGHLNYDIVCGGFYVSRKNRPAVTA